MNPLERQIKKGESAGLEFLKSADGWKTVVPHVVALLNSGGGTVVVGVDDDRKLVGVDGAEDLARRLGRELSEAISPKALFSANAEVIGGKSLVVIEVPGGRDTPFVTEGKVYLRRGACTSAATGEDLQSLFQKRTPETERWERRGSPLLELEDLGEEEIFKTVQAAQAAGRFRFQEPQSPESVLNDLGMRERGMLTNASDVCLGRTPAVRNPQVRLRAFAFRSDKRGDDYIDQADLNGPVARVIADATAFIQRNSSLAAQFLPDSIERRNLAPYPAFAVREGLVNALAHRDYGGFSSGATLLVYPDRVEIWNSGQLPKGWSASKLRHTHPSLPANPDIAHFLFIRNLMERVGRGTVRMIEACREAKIPAPTWKVDEDGITLTLYSLASQEAPVAQLSDRQLRFLESTEPGDTIRLQDYVERFARDVSYRQAQRDLGELREADLLRLEGKGRGAYYIRTERGFKG